MDIWTWLRDADNREIASFILTLSAAVCGGLAWLSVRLWRLGRRTGSGLDKLTSFLGHDTRIPTPSRLDLARFSSTFHSSRVRDVSSTHLLTELGIVRGRHLTRLGVLLLHESPQSVLPSALVHFVHFTGTSKASATTENRQIRGTLPEQLATTARLLEASTATHQVAESEEMIAKYRRDYSMTVIREVLVNALCHRNYEDQTRSVMVHVFSNRIEILSPGNWGAHGRLTENETVSIIDLDSTSVSRNPGLADALYCLGYGEKSGTGVQKIAKQSQKRDMPTPTVAYLDGYTSVTIYPKRRTQDHLLAEEGIRPLQQPRGSESNISEHDTQERRPRRSARQAVEKMTSGQDWDGDTLCESLRAAIAAEVPISELEEAVVVLIDPKRSPREVGCLLNGAGRAGLKLERDRVFELWRRPRRDIELDMKRIPPAGSDHRFLMGATDTEDDRNSTPRHWVTLSAFEISATPITEEQYSHFDSAKPCARRDLPVTSVSWWEAWLYCNWAGGNLPTEAQWEAACRANTSSSWWSGPNEHDVRTVAWVEDDEDLYAKPVGLKKANPWGLHDMHGNVWEWCLDCYLEYSLDPQTNPSWLDGNKLRVLRGGAITEGPALAKSSFRLPRKPDKGGLLTSFRLVRPLPTSRATN